MFLAMCRKIGEILITNCPCPLSSDRYVVGMHYTALLNVFSERCNSMTASANTNPLFACCAPPRPSTQLTLTVLVATIDAQWEGMGDVGSARYEPALLPPCPTIKILSYSN